MAECVGFEGQDVEENDLHDVVSLDGLVVVHSAHEVEVPSNTSAALSPIARASPGLRQTIDMLSKKLGNWQKSQLRSSIKHLEDSSVFYKLL